MVVSPVRVEVVWLPGWPRVDGLWCGRLLALVVKCAPQRALPCVSLLPHIRVQNFGHHKKIPPHIQRQPNTIASSTPITSQTTSNPTDKPSQSIRNRQDNTSKMAATATNNPAR